MSGTARARAGWGTRGPHSARRGAATLAAFVALAAVGATAWAIWSAPAGATSHGAAVAAGVNQGATPTASAGAGRAVTVSWGASTLTGGHAVDGYVVKRYDSAGGTAQTVLAGCSGTISATSCIEAGVPAGGWKYSVTPVIATNWQGAESVKSGAVTVAAATLSLARTLFGATLPEATSGSVAGFAANEGVTYRLDAGTTLTGSPAVVSAAGAATITSLTIPATTDGAHTVYALGDASPFASLASVGIVVDTAAPTVTPSLSPAANGAGWNDTAPVLVTLSASDGTGSGVAQIKYTTNGSDPTTSGSVYSAAISVSANTTVKYLATDNAGNSSSVQTQLVKIDATAPTNAISLSSVTGGAFQSGATIYYAGGSSGSFALTNALTDTGGSGPASSGTAALAGTATGWSHTSSLVSTPAGGPYVSNPFSWAAGTSSAPTETVTASDVADNTSSTTFTVTPDTTVPTAGALTVNGAAATGPGSGSGSSTGSFAIARTDYTDAGSGLLSSVLTVATGTLSSSDGIVAGTCSAFGSASVLTGAPAQTVSGPACYLYTLTGTDRVGNVAVISTTVKVDTTAPSAPSPTVSAATGSTFISGSTVFINAQAGKSGGFQAAAMTTDAQSGILKVDFPALSGFTSGGGDVGGSPFQTTYAWTGAVAASGAQTVTASNPATGTATASFTITADTTGPTGGALSVNAVPGSVGGSVSGSTTGSFAIARTDYSADALSGFASSVLTVQTGTLSTSDGIAAGTCSAFGTASVLTGAPAQTVTGPACYLYTLTGTDKVGNASGISTTVTVDATAPSAPSLTLSAATGNTFVSGTAAFINPQAGKSGGFQVAASTTDAQSGILKVNFPAPAGFTSGGGDVGASPFQTTYAWSGAVAATGAQTVTASNPATGTATSTFTITPDTTGPTGGALTVNGVGAGAATSSWSATGNFSISRTDYSADGAGSGLASSVLTVQTGTLSSSDGIAPGTCSAFGTASTLTGSPAQTVTGPHCYLYALTGADQVGNVAAVSTTVKVDSTAPTAPVLTLSNAAGNTYIPPGGTTVVINPQAAKAGSFKVAATSGDPDSGIQKLNFPVLPGFTSGGGDVLASPFTTTYA